MALFSTIIAICLIFLVIYIVNNNKLKENQAKIVNNDVAIYNDKDVKDEEADKNNEQLKENSNNSMPVKSDVRFTALGEIMMGGQVTKNLNYMYINAFKKIYPLTNSADITFSTLDTNIVSLSTITDDTKSKYLVTKDILSGLETLGVDSVSVATEHMIDFSDNIFKNTVDILNKDKIYASGLQNTPVYFDKNNQKIAIISANDVIIGTSTNYISSGINIYNLDNIKQEIAEAKQSSDFVVVSVNWGREYLYGVTDRMKQIAKDLIDAGANLIIGSNALGVYPIIEYKNVPIIYSTGYFISDSDYNLAKQGYIFDIDIDKDSKVKSMTLTPIYVQDKKNVSLYFEYKSEEAQDYIDQMNTWNIQNGLDSNIVNNKIVINFKNV